MARLQDYANLQNKDVPMPLRPWFFLCNQFLIIFLISHILKLTLPLWFYLMELSNIILSEPAPPTSSVTDKGLCSFLFLIFKEFPSSLESILIETLQTLLSIRPSLSLSLQRCTQPTTYLLPSCIASSPTATREHDNI